MMRRGEIWTANLNTNKGSEIGKVRPVLILQDDSMIASGLATILIAPLTSQFRPIFAPLRVKVAARNHLVQDCFVMIEHIRVLDRSRFGEGPLATLNTDEMASVEKSLLGVLGML
jgi:mRNA interferase MazF